VISFAKNTDTNNAAPVVTKDNTDSIIPFLRPDIAPISKIRIATPSIIYPVITYL
jgi:hypothetical protein